MRVGENQQDLERDLMQSRERNQRGVHDTEGWEPEKVGGTINKNRDHRSSRFALGDEKFNLDKVESWGQLAHS